MLSTKKESEVIESNQGNTKHAIAAAVKKEGKEAPPVAADLQAINRVDNSSSPTMKRAERGDHNEEGRFEDLNSLAGIRVIFSPTRN